MKNSQKLLLGFAVVAAILIAVVALKYPPVESPDAQGSIGAVEKYREDQIKPADVVLGDEQNRKLEAAIYGSLLEQAAQLQSFSADLAGITRNLDNRDQLEAFARGLGAREDQVASKALLAAADLQSQDQLESFQADLQSMARAFENRSNLAVKSLESFESQLEAMERDLAAKTALEAEALMEAQSRLDSMKQLDSEVNSLESMNADLASFADALEARSKLEARVLQSRVLESRLQQLGARVLEQKALLGVKQDLAMAEQNLESRADLGAASKSLESRNADFLGLATRLESRALDNMSTRLEMRNLEAKSLLGIRQMTESFSRNLGSRDNLESKQLASMQADLQSFQKTLDSRVADLNQKFSLGARAELAAINTHLESRSNLSNKLNLGSDSELAAKSNLGAKTDLGAEAALESRNNLGSFDQYLGSLSKSLESRTDLASRENDLAARAQELQNRAADLQSKSNF